MTILEVRNQKSGRYAFIQEEGGHSVYLYITDTTTLNIVADVLVVSLIQPIKRDEVESYRIAGGPPPIVEGFQTEAGVRLGGRPAFALIWSLDGESAAATVDGVAFAMTSAVHPHSLSKAVCRPGPWASPWDEQIFQQVFATIN